MAETEIGGPNGRWASTLWATVLRARDAHSQDGRAALEKLATLYWKPVYFYIRHRHRDIETAKDLTQSFFAYFLEHDLVSRARPEAGRFRAYLRTVLHRFLSDDRDRARAAKRGGQAARVPLEFAEAEAEFAYGPSQAQSPQEVYDRAWIEETIARTLDRFRAECAQQGRAHWYEALRLRFGSRGESPSYADLARSLGVSEEAVTNYLHRARERFREILIEEVGQAVAGPADLSEELRILGELL
ncbi:MAG: sigma-70 family RNA polymerase sigma factor [Planctomycetes bacterium]|nr:sigma-70 family RNA polymerase sigma factor [Planctomycetota bacterium]